MSELQDTARDALTYLADIDLTAHGVDGVWRAAGVYLEDHDLEPELQDALAVEMARQLPSTSTYSLTLTGSDGEQVRHQILTRSEAEHCLLDIGQNAIQVLADVDDGTTAGWSEIEGMRWRLAVIREECEVTMAFEDRRVRCTRDSGHGSLHRADVPGQSGYLQWGRTER